MVDTTQHDFYTVSEAARWLSVNPSTIWRWIRSGKLAAYRVGEHSIRIRRVDLETAISPIHGPDESQKPVEQYDPDAVLAAIAETAGSWADVDIDNFIADVYAAREAGSRPAHRP